VSVSYQSSSSSRSRRGIGVANSDIGKVAVVVLIVVVIVLSVVAYFVSMESNITGRMLSTVSCIQPIMAVILEYSLSSFIYTWVTARLLIPSWTFIHVDLVFKTSTSQTHKY